MKTLRPTTMSTLPSTLTLTLLTATTLLSLIFFVTPVHGMADRCYPSKPTERTCMMGCLSCWKTYGGELYDMVSCCKECRGTGSTLVDFAPTHCSTRHVQKTWLKRFG